MKTIRMITLLAALMLGFALQARAQSAINFDYTGVTANDFAPDLIVGDPGSYGTWISGSGGGVVWPSEAAGALGVAEQFTITAPTIISALNTSVMVPLDPALSPGQGNASTILTWDLYSGTTFEELQGKIYPNNLVPLISSLVLQSAPVTYTTNFNSPTQTVTDQLAFNVDLEPGTYWIAQEGIAGGGAVVDPSQTYLDPPGGGNTAQTPQPAVWITMGLCALFILWRGGRYVESLV